MHLATTDVLPAKREALPESEDLLLGKVRSLAGELGAWEKNLPIDGGTFSGKDIYKSTECFDKGRIFSDYPYRPPNVAVPDATSMVRKIVANSVCLTFVDIVGAIGIAEMMEAKPKIQAQKARASSEGATLRKVRPAPEAYPDLDLDRIKERVAELSAASSDSAAVSMVFRRSIQIVVHSDE